MIASSRVVFLGEFETIMNRWINRKRYNGQDNHPEQCRLSSKQLYTIIAVLASRSKIKHAMLHTDFSIKFPNNDAVKLSGVDITTHFSEADHLTWKNLLNKIEICKMLALKISVTYSDIIKTSENKVITEEEVGQRIQVNLGVCE